ncbi:MAG: hypothetical protein RIB45_09305 [Marivibrio sp.]|uniref:hypothetical protein n=1 Tax=Marivibrio sp. TaxID=2039719 RepID=UPI0032EE5BF0
MTEATGGAGLDGPMLGRALSIAGLTVDGSSSALSVLAGRFMRLNAHQKRHYEANWAELLNRLERVLDAAASAADVLAEMDPPPESDGLVSAFIRRQSFPVRIAPGAFVPKPGHLVVVSDGRYRQAPRAACRDERYRDAVVAAIDPRVDAVVELGCGWGRNLAAIAARLGRPDLHYVGAEQSHSGRQAAQALMAKPGGGRFTAAAFDFYAPDFSFLEGLKNPVIFSCAAVEQIAFLPPSFLVDLAKRAPGCRLVLFEPFGWQADAALAQATLGRCLTAVRDNAPLSAIAERYRFDLDDAVLNANASVWALCCCYNMNLFSLIRRGEADGLFAIEELVLNQAGSNLFNPYSLAVLRIASDA